MLKFKQVLRICGPIYTDYLVVQTVANPPPENKPSRAAVKVNNFPGGCVVHPRAPGAADDLPPLFVHEDLLAPAVAQHQVTRVQQRRYPSRHLQFRATRPAAALLYVHRKPSVVEPGSVLGVPQVRAAGAVLARRIVKVQDPGVVGAVAILCVPFAHVVEPGVLLGLENAAEQVGAKVEFLFLLLFFLLEHFCVIRFWVILFIGLWFRWLVLFLRFWWR